MAYVQDLVFIKLVRKLVQLAKNAIEEAESYAEEIKDPDLQKEAQDLLDSI